MADVNGCPVAHGYPDGGMGLQDWWPNRVNLNPLRRNHPGSSPMDASFNYRAAVKDLDVDQLKKDVAELMRTSQDWWPADYGHYGPLFVRLSWHAAGTYRIFDGRGGASTGMQRFAPENSWPDNANLDKARRLLWPIKAKYGDKLSWADLLVFAGNFAMEDMGFKTFGFAFGRDDAWEPDETYYGPEKTWLADERYSGERDLANPLAAVQMGLIYVNPEGPNGNPDPLLAARDIRETFRRMAMNDEETVALIAGGHTFGKAHGATPAQFIGVEPEGAPIEAQGIGWHNSNGSGNGANTTTGGPEGAWTTNPIAWDNNFWENLYNHEWELTTSPAGAKQWTPKAGGAVATVPDAHIAGKTHPVFMLTTDLALRFDPAYDKISRRFKDNPQEFADAYARAWYKLIHRDMGPYELGVGPLLPAEPQLWQDPIPAVNHPLIGAADIAALKQKILGSGLTTAQLVTTAWASASTFRHTDRRGGANGARIRLEPQKNWEVNEPAKLATVLSTLEGIQREFNGSKSDGTKVSLADLIVLGGCAAVEDAARKAGYSVEVPFTPGRMDAAQEQTDVESFQALQPIADAFRNYVRPEVAGVAEHLMVDKADLLTLTAPELTVLVGGLRVLGANYQGSQAGVLTTRPGQLSNDFFVNLLDMGTRWDPTSDARESFVGRDAKTGAQKWTASRVDLIFGSHSELRSYAEVYGSNGAGEKFARDFAAAFAKVMNADRYDLQ